MPLPASPYIGFGMNVAVWPCRTAVILATYFTSMPMSPASTIPASGISSSTWPGPPTSW